MSRNFGISFEKVTADPALRGGEQLDRPDIAPGAQRKSNIYYFQSPGGVAPSHRSDSQASNPALFIPACPAFKRSQFTQALIDVLAVGMVVSVICVAALAVAIPFLIAGLLVFSH